VALVFTTRFGKSCDNTSVTCARGGAECWFPIARHACVTNGASNGGGGGGGRDDGRGDGRDDFWRQLALRLITTLRVKGPRAVRRRRRRRAPAIVVVVIVVAVAVAQ
jgi:hypothetical protein